MSVHTNQTVASCRARLAASTRYGASDQELAQLRQELAEAKLAQQIAAVIKETPLGAAQVTRLTELLSGGDAA